MALLVETPALWCWNEAGKLKAKPEGRSELMIVT